MIGPSPRSDTIGGVSSARSRHLSIRINETDLDNIDRRAAGHKLSRTEYLIRSALGELADPGELDERMDALDRRMDRLETFAFGG